MKKAFLVLSIFVGALISVCAAIMSVSGLAAIFKGNPLVIMGMGSVLEAAKVLISVYTHVFWGKARKMILVYLTFALLVLMCITSLGIYGYLSKSYLMHTDTSMMSTKVASLQTTIGIEKQKMQIIIDQINSITRTPAEEKTQWHNYRLKSLSGELDGITQKLDSLNMSFAEEKGKQTSLELEVGPIKYLAYIIYGKSEREAIDNAVQFFIVIIVLVFDPLAILMILSGIHAIHLLEKSQQLAEDPPVEEVVVKKKEKKVVQPKIVSSPLPAPEVYEVQTPEPEPVLVSSVIVDEPEMFQVVREPKKKKIKKIEEPVPVEETASEEVIQETLAEIKQDISLPITENALNAVNEEEIEYETVELPPLKHNETIIREDEFVQIVKKKVDFPPSEMTYTRMKKIKKNKELEDQIDKMYKKKPMENGEFLKEKEDDN